MKHTELHAVPEIEGLSFRGFRGKVDYPAMMTILDGSDVFDEIEQVNSLETSSDHAPTLRIVIPSGTYC